MKNLFLVIAVLVSTVIKAQTQTENYIKTTAYQKEVKEGEQSQVLESDKIISVNYFDGLGRAKQSVAVRAGGQKQSTNILDWTDDWAIGTGPTSLFNIAGRTIDNKREFGVNPFGEQSLLWRCGNNENVQTNAGWNSDHFDIDKTVGYRYTVWVKRTGSGSATLYHGIWDVNFLSGTNAGNPYFFHSKLPQTNTWYLLVGMIYPHTYTGGNPSVSGIYDMNGNKVVNGTDFKWKSTATSTRLRDFYYDGTATNSYAYYWNPKISKVDNNLQPIAQLIEQSKPKDIVTHYEYDDYGRQVKEYLPFASDQTQNGAIYTNPLAKINSFYNTAKYQNTTNPYSQTIYDDSPLNRVVEQAAPGESWKYDPSKVNTNDVTYTYDKEYELSESFRVSDLIGVGAGGGGGSVKITGNTLTVSIEGSWSPHPLITYKPITNLYPNPLVPINVDLGQLTDFQGNMLPYEIRIEATSPGSPSKLMISSIGSPATIGGIKFTASVQLPDLGTDTYTFSRRESTNHSIKNHYEVNKKGTGSVIRFTPSLQQDGYYRDGQLTKVVTSDENWKPSDIRNHTTEEYKDWQGRVILKRTFNNNNPHDTYYVYDTFGNLTYVVPPKVTTDDGISDTEIDELCYRYKYDSRNRLIEKKIPGKGWEYIVYNKLDQTVITQDANQRSRNEWSFTKYDAFGRVAFTGLHIHPGTISRGTMQGFADTGNYTQYVTKRATSLSVAGTAIYYSNDAIPTGINKIYTINYYDDYEVGNVVAFNPANSSGTWEEMTATAEVKGLPTVSQVRVLGTDQWITTATYYDNKGRAWETHIKNDYLDTEDWVLNKLDFVGKILKTQSTHTKGSNTPIKTVDIFTYDHMGRLVTQKQQINDFAEELIVHNLYDDLGQLESKKVGNAEQAPLQNVDYKYNVRGWLTDINDVSSIGDDLFTFKIHYDQVEGYYNVPKLYNGNISQTIWKTANDQVKRSYSYQYDDLNRITTAHSLKGSTLMSGDSFSMWGIAYDKNGNIGRITRNGRPGGSTTRIDELYYTYSNNKLLKVREAVTSINKNYGFKDGTNIDNDYLYDDNGNMIIDKNKNISSITYNHLNLPESIEFVSRIPSQQKRIDYVYDATGVKLRKVVTNYPSSNTTEYAGNYIYESNYSLGLPPGPNNSDEKKLKFFNHPEGYTEPNGTGEFDYVYQLKDHLGNIRISYSDKDKDGHIDILRNDADVDGDGDLAHEILQEKNYYPFGLQHKGYNNTITGRKHNYGFGGKEEQSELGLEWIDITARNYDPAIGRWMNLDPLAEGMRKFSPYNYAWDNPINVIDPDGMFGIFVNENGEQIGDDGIDDDKVYVVKTDQTTVDSGAPFDGITTEQKEATIDFITSNSGNTAAFQENSIAYDNSVEIAGSESTRKSMVKIANQDDGTGGTNLTKLMNTREFGGTVQKDGTVKDAGIGGSSSINLDKVTDTNTKSRFHTHPSGEKVDMRGFTTGSVDGPSHEGALGTGRGDIGAHRPNRTSYIFQRGNGKVYIYNEKSGIQAIIPQSNFVKLPKATQK